MALANGEINFIFIVTHPYSLVKATMNAPHVCKLRKKCLTGIDQCAMVLSKHLNFVVFQLLKAEKRPLRTCQLLMGLKYKKVHCKLWDEKKYIQSVQQIFMAHI